MSYKKSTEVLPSSRRHKDVLQPLENVEVAIFDAGPARSNEAMININKQVQDLQLGREGNRQQWNFSIKRAGPQLACLCKMIAIICNVKKAS